MVASRPLFCWRAPCAPRGRRRRRGTGGDDIGSGMELSRRHAAAHCECTSFSRPPGTACKRSDLAGSTVSLGELEANGVSPEEGSWSRTDSTSIAVSLSRRARTVVGFGLKQ